MSRNQREGYYIGTWAGRHLRKRGKVGIYQDDDPDPLFPPAKPLPDNGWAWTVAWRRSGGALRVRRPRYLTKAERALLAGER